MFTHLLPVCQKLTPELKIQIPYPSSEAISVSLGVILQNTRDWVTYKEQKFVSHSSGGQEVQYQGTGRSTVWEEPAFWFIDVIDGTPLCVLE